MSEGTAPDGLAGTVARRVLLGVVILILVAGAFAAGSSLTAPNAARSVNGCIGSLTKTLEVAHLDLPTYDGLRLQCHQLFVTQNAADEEAASTAILANQRFNTNVLMWLVVLITLSGVGLAAVQLYWSFRLAMTGHATGFPGTDSDSTISPREIAVKSSVVGVSVLAISLAFFAMYVLNVYPVTLVPPKTAPVQTGTLAPSAAPGGK